MIVREGIAQVCVLIGQKASLLLALATLPRFASAADDIAAAPALPDTPASVPSSDADTLWTWLERFDGEVASDGAAGLDETESSDRVEVAMVERALIEGRDGLDVPLDYYTDPERVLTGDPLHLDLVDPAAFDIPIALNDHVKQWMRLLLGPLRSHFEAWIARKGRYEAMISKEAAAMGVPADLLYLSMIESGFKPEATSRVGAAGLWQFMTATGRSYGLSVDSWVDERRDPELATRAALRYLSDLYKQFGDWQLAFAAYNTGPGRVRRAMQAVPDNAETKPDYWTLVDHNLLFRETQGYVPKIIAAAVLSKYASHYGLDHVAPEAPYEVDSLTLDSAVDIDVLARCASLSESEFRAINPSLRSFSTPEGGTLIHVPVGMAESFEDALAKVPASERRKLVLHRVSTGESLGSIASRYGIPMSAIISANRIRNANRIAVGQKLVIPIRGDASSAETVQLANPTVRGPSPIAPTADAEIPQRYTVRSGDTLSAIAQRFRVSETWLRTWNQIDDASALRVGTVLSLKAPEVAQAASSEPQTPSTYRVKAGDSLSVIAERHHLRTADLAAWNKLSSASAIQVGQTLVLQAPTSARSGSDSSSFAAQTYRVQSGDALSKIAERFHVSTSDLVAWNKLSSASAIQVGQTLVLQAPTSARSEPATVTPPAAKGAVAPAPSGPTAQTYRVQSGDVLGKIAERFHVSTSDLVAWNRLSSASSLQVGQTLVLQAPAEAGPHWVVHTVRSGDSLGAIAIRYHVSVDDLRAWNKIKGSTIHPGDKLKVRTP